MRARSQRTLPKWDRKRRELWFEGKLCKRVAETATAQISVLDAFEEEGWPEHIFDPLSPSGDVDPSQRLGDTLRRLNSCGHLLFRRDGKGEGICWLPRE